MIRSIPPAFALWVSMLAAAPAAAHHSFAAEFDSNQQIELTGTVTKVEWMNPHTYVFIDVKEKTTGVVENWAWEMASPNGLMRRGWTLNSMRVGDVVTVTGTRAKDGSRKAHTSSVVFTDGQRLFVSNPGDAR